jgi:hypothetical protein
MQWFSRLASNQELHQKMTALIILSPVRLPFRHTGYLLFTMIPAVL